MDYEKLGLFYLGKVRDVARGETKDDLVLYDSRHLVTHAVVVGMTGSGKTGLCIDLLEEAALDGVPVIAIDPKGDIGNLLLTFPELRPEDFAPYVDPAEAQRKGIPEAELATRTAATWREGLGRWGMDGRRIASLRAAADVVVYTPGSTAGAPLSVLRAFEPPPPGEDEESMRERIASSVTGLLALAGIDADVMQSREHILLSSIVEASFRTGRGLDLPGLIAAVQAPPFEKVGVLDLESFYPAKERFSLVMTLNNLVASPAFAAWSAGEPLDVASLLRTRDGRPKISILSIAHLDDAQRMFFVTLLLNAVLSHTRSLSGTSSLRAIVYMDEIFGYFPPVANPPSKKPLLTLLKQARAFGVGVVLATQNPVDLDYKGLANTGTWFLGRLQTERDKQRVLEGLEGAAATAGSSFDREAMDRTLSGLTSRTFLLHNVHAGAPVVFETRWAMSYLRGPMTRAELRRFAEQRAGAAPAGFAASPGIAAPSAAPAPAAPAATPATTAIPEAPRHPRPALPPEVPQCFLPLVRARPHGAVLVYRPMLLGLVKVQLSDTKAGVDRLDAFGVLTPITDDPVPVHWEQGHVVAVASTSLERAPAFDDAEYVPVHAAAAQAKKYTAWSRDLVTHVVATHRLELVRSPSTKLVSAQGESEAAFRQRLATAARERRDAEVERLRQRYAPKVAQIDERIRRGYAAVEREKSQAEEASVGAAFSVGSAVFGALTGRGTLTQANVGRAATAARGASRRSRAKADVEAAEAAVATLLTQRKALEDQFLSEVAALDAHAGAREVLDVVSIKPKKAGVTIVHVTLAFAPYARFGDTPAEPLFA